jgi:hypothetical protein
MKPVDALLAFENARTDMAHKDTIKTGKRSHGRCCHSDAAS